MKSHLLRWALACVTVIAVTALSNPAAAGPRKTVVIGPGDSIDSLARTYHVAIRDIARANHISPNAVLVDGHKLIIPDPPKTAIRPATMRRRAWVNGDRISVRLGPDETARRLTLLDHGDPLLATARHEDWTQVKLASGRIGWIRSDFLRVGEEMVSGRRRAGREAPAPEIQRHRTRVAKAEADQDSSSARRRARARAERRREAARLEQRRHRLRIAHRHPSERTAREHSRIASRRQRRPEADAPRPDSDVVRTAFAYRGTPYRFGGSGRRGFDCSGFTSYVYGRKGVNLPHSAAEQFGHGRKIDSGHLKEGDLVFFHTTRRGISHVGIYVGNGKFVHASSAGGRVRVDELHSGYYRERFRGARRVR